MIIAFPPRLLICLFPVICLELSITRTFFDFSRRAELSGVDCNTTVSYQLSYGKRATITCNLQVCIIAAKRVEKLEKAYVAGPPTVNSENKPRGLYFSKALFEGLIFGGAYPRREICVSKSIRLAS